MLGFEDDTGFVAAYLLICVSSAKFMLSYLAAGVIDRLRGLFRSGSYGRVAAAFVFVAALLSLATMLESISYPDEHMMKPPFLPTDGRLIDERDA